MAGKQVVRVASSTLYRDLAGEGVLLQLDTGEYFGLDEVGNRVWQLIVEVGDVDAIRRRMLADYDVRDDVLAADLDRLLAQLVEKKLVEVTDEDEALNAGS